MPESSPSVVSTKVTSSIVKWLSIPGLSFLAMCTQSCRTPPSIEPPSVRVVPVTIHHDAEVLPETQRKALQQLVIACRDLPQTEWEGEDLVPSADSIREAATLVETEGQDPALAQSLRQIERALRLQDFDEHEGHFASRSPLLVVLSAYGRETTDAPPERCGLEIGLRDAKTHEWIDPFTARVAEFERSLPLSPEHRSIQDGAPRHRLVVGDIAFRGGSFFESARLTSRVPFAPATPEDATTFVFWKNLIRKRWFDLDVRPSAVLTLEPSLHPLATPGSLLRLYATRYSTFQLGPQFVVSADGTETSLRDHFEETWSPLAVAKADVLATLAQHWLVGQGVLPEETTRENLTMFIVLCFRSLYDAVFGDAPGAHAPASALIVNWLQARDALRFDGKSERWRLDFERMIPALKSLAANILELHATGDKSGAGKLIERYGKIDEPTAVTLGRFHSIPRSQVQMIWAIDGM